MKALPSEHLALRKLKFKPTTNNTATKRTGTKMEAVKWLRNHSNPRLLLSLLLLVSSRPCPARGQGQRAGPGALLGVLLAALQCSPGRGQDEPGCAGSEGILVGAIVGTFILTVTIGCLALLAAWMVKERLGGRMKGQKSQ